jgi:hypothetical protein
MHQIWTLRKITLIFFFVLVCSGCTKTVSQNDVIGLTAENVLEGVRLTVDHIPPETNYAAFIFTAEGENTHSLSTELYEWGLGTLLEEFKETPTLVCPFVQKGLTYTVTAYVKKENSDSFYKESTEIIPDNGILFVPNSITLKLNEAKTGAALSAFPELSRTAQYGVETKYSYLINNEEQYQPAEGEFDSLVFDFSARLNEVKAGNTPYNIAPYCQIKYDNLTWVLNFCEPAFFK